MRPPIKGASLVPGFREIGEGLHVHVAGGSVAG